MAHTTTIRLADHHVTDADALAEFVGQVKLKGVTASRSDVLRFAIDIGLKKLKIEASADQREREANL